MPTPLARPLHRFRPLVRAQKLIVRPHSAQQSIRRHYPLFQSPSEEWVNGLTHAAAALMSLVASVWLVWAAARQGDLLMILGCAAYSASLTAVFAMSTLSHLVETPRLRLLFRTLDQAAIFLLTAGSCTPYFIRYLLLDGWAWLLPLLWGLALLCAWDKLRGHRVNSVSLLPYVVLGWFPILAFKPMLLAMPTGCLLLVIASGGCYMLG
ncbi:MAG TPA: hemolysin III family protein, partial [Planctomycetaceae bacterium]|nr:hemolysin III family protein [Planctomycetaceae bacterium]